MDLFDISEAPPSQSHSATSVAAAETMEPSAGTLRAAVLAFLRKRHPDGATDEAQGRDVGGNSMTRMPDEKFDELYRRWKRGDQLAAVEVLALQREVKMRKPDESLYDTVWTNTPSTEYRR